jgi:vanadium chloroperoxidase
LHITRLFYGASAALPDQLFEGLCLVSEEFDGTNRDNRGTVRPVHRRSFPGGLWQMIEENGRSRVFLGVHWVFDAFMVDKSGRPDLSQCIGGVPLGLEIARDIFNDGRAAGLRQSTVGPGSYEGLAG